MHSGQYKGTVSSVGGYRFTFTVVDGPRSGGGGQGKFRIRFWGPAESCTTTR